VFFKLFLKLSFLKKLTKKLMIPLTKWISPFKPNSPKIMILSGICKSFFIFFNKDTAIGKSKCEPFLFISTGSKFIMYFLGGNSI
jgi:hypothetical protein